MLRGFPEGSMASVEGGCLCGAVRYRLTAAPLYSVICHCVSCRKASAAPSVAWLTVRAGDFQLLRGVPRGFRSSAGVLRTFCERCGTPLTYVNERSEGSIDLTTVSLDDPARFAPTKEGWLEDKLPWEVTNPHLEQHARGTGG